MPYFIEKGNTDCKSGWAVVDADGAIYGCHQTKKDAIDQAVAVSLATDEPFEGERTLNIGDNRNMDIRATAEELKPGVWVQWIQEDKIEYGAVIQVDGDMAQVTPWDEEDGGWSAEAEVQLVEIGRLQVIPALPAPESEEDKPVETLVGVS